MVAFLSGENSLELVNMIRMGWIIGLLLVSRLEMELNFLGILRLYSSIGLLKHRREEGDNKMCHGSNEDEGRQESDAPF